MAPGGGGVGACGADVGAVRCGLGGWGEAEGRVVRSYRLGNGCRGRLAWVAGELATPRWLSVGRPRGGERAFITYIARCYNKPPAEAGRKGKKYIDFVSFLGPLGGMDRGPFGPLGSAYGWNSGSRLLHTKFCKQGGNVL